MTPGSLRNSPAAGTDSETSTLLADSFADDRPFSSATYGTVEADSDDSCRDGQQGIATRKYSNAFIARTVFALFVGAFTANADGSLVMATHPVIGSEFNDLESSSWLVIGFSLAGLATQTLYGKLSDIFGRKALILICYGLFAAGCALVGVGQTMWQVILGRVISGSGGAGLTVLVALVITDLVPVREVAAWQSYLNIVATTGRSIGGPAGGWLADTIGWRWSFLGQAPIFFAALCICWIVLPPLKPDTKQENDKSAVELKNIDFAGVLTLGVGVFSLMLPLEIGGSKMPWNHPIIVGLFVFGAILLGLFLLVEEYWAKDPVLPTRLLRNPNAILCYVISSCIIAAQVAMMFTVPLYFQVTQRTSSTVAGAHLFPAVAGNAVAALATGHIIQQRGQYKSLLILSGICASTCYLLLILRWHGNTNWAESMYIIPGGVGAGIAQTAVFTGLQATIDPADNAPAISALFLTIPAATTTTIAIASAVMAMGLRNGLLARLAELGLSASDIQNVVERATESVDYVDQVPPGIARAIVDSYVEGLEYSHYASLTIALVALLAAILLRERPLRK